MPSVDISLNEEARVRQLEEQQRKSSKGVELRADIGDSCHTAIRVFYRRAFVRDQVLSRQDIITQEAPPIERPFPR